MALVAPAAHELGRVRSIAVGLALAWSVALVIGAFVLPVYSTSGSEGDGTDTLVGANGVHVVGVVMIPVAIVGIVAAALSRRNRSASAGPVAWTVTGVLAVFNLLAMLSIGIFVLPVTMCLAVACAHRSSAT